jgi:hypothetical protein
VTEDLPDWAQSVLMPQYLWEHYGIPADPDELELRDVYRAMRLQDAQTKRTKNQSERG